MSDDRTKHLYETADAMEWAKTFCAMVRENPAIATDEGTMVGWFANAMVTAEDIATKRQREVPIAERIREIVFLAAGAAAGVALPDDQVFPSREVEAAVERICAEHGLASNHPTGVAP